MAFPIENIHAWFYHNINRRNLPEWFLKLLSQEEILKRIAQILQAQEEFNEITVDEINLLWAELGGESLAPRVIALEDAVEEIQTELESLLVEFSDLEGEVEDVRIVAEDGVFRVASLETTVSGLAADVSANSGIITDHEGRIETLENSGGSDPTLEPRVSALEDSVGDLETTTGNLEGSVSDLDDSVDTLETAVSQAEGEIASLDGRVGQNESDIASNSSDISGHGTRIDTLEGSVSDLDDSIDTLNTSVSQAEGEISALDTRVGQNETDISDLQSKKVDVSTGELSETSVNLQQALLDLDGAGEGAVLTIQDGALMWRGGTPPPSFYTVFTVSGTNPVITASPEENVTSMIINGVEVEEPFLPGGILNIPSVPVGEVIEVDLEGDIHYFGKITPESTSGSGGVVSIYELADSIVSMGIGYETLIEVPYNLPTSLNTMSNMFNGATAFNDYNVAGWYTSNITDMSGMFNGATAFNQYINFDVSGVSDMSSMFNGATSFDQDLSGWNTFSVTDMSSMFNGATAFNQDLSSWTTFNVTNMAGMFNGATSFNGDLGVFETYNVTDMSSMFYNASAFNQDLSGWDTYNVVDFTDFDTGATSWQEEFKPDFY